MGKRTARPNRLRQVVGRIDKRLYRYGILSPRSLTLPKFLGIGAQKAGTTWLHQNLSRHPEVFFPEVAAPRTTEVHYFDLEFHQSVRSYAARFAAAGDRVSGDITPAYGILSAERIRFVRAVMPDVRLILMLRDPVERAWSQAVMNLVTQPGRALHEVPHAEFIEHFLGSPSLRRGAYLRIMESWLDTFPEEQLFVGWFEDIGARPEGLLCDVLRHIEVTAEVDLEAFPLARRFNYGGGHPVPGALRNVLEDIYAADIETLYDRLGERVGKWRPAARAQT